MNNDGLRRSGSLAESLAEGILSKARELTDRNRESRQILKLNKTVTDRKSDFVKGYVSHYNAELGKTVAITPYGAIAYQGISGKLPLPDKTALIQPSSKTIDFN